jgi:hypothetical protein
MIFLILLILCTRVATADWLEGAAVATDPPLCADARGGCGAALVLTVQIPLGGLTAVALETEVPALRGIFDSLGRPWRLSAGFTVSVRSDTPIRTEYVLEAPSGPYWNRFVSKSTAWPQEGSPPGDCEVSVCCLRSVDWVSYYDQYHLERTQSSYLMHRAVRPSAAVNLTLTVASEYALSSEKKLLVSLDEDAGLDPRIASYDDSVQLLSSAAVFDAAAPSLAGRLVVVPSTPTEPPFLMPDDAALIGSGVHQIGITPAAWVEAAQRACSVPGSSAGAPEYLTSVSGGGPGDQFAAFRSASLISALAPDCYLVELADKLRFVCSRAGTLMAQLRLEAPIVPLVPQFPVPRMLLAQGMPRLTSSRQLVLEVLIRNIGGAAGEMSLGTPLGCCAAAAPGSPECDGGSFSKIGLYSASVTVEPDADAELFIVAMLAPQAAAPVVVRCSVDVIAGGYVAFREAVEFIMPPAVFAKDAAGRGIRSPSAPCTVDEVLVASTQTCVATDCVLAYGGGRNWFNPVARRCESVVTCNSTQRWDPSRNVCVGPVVPPPSNLTTCALDSDCGNSSEALPNPRGLHCGEHGAVDASNSTCVCDDGYFSDPMQSALNFTWCGVFGSIHPASAEGSGSGSAAAETIAVVVVVAVLGCVCCVCCACCCACVVVLAVAAPVAGAVLVLGGRSGVTALRPRGSAMLSVLRARAAAVLQGSDEEPVGHEMDSLTIGDSGHGSDGDRSSAAVFVDSCDTDGRPLAESALSLCPSSTTRTTDGVIGARLESFKAAMFSTDDSYGLR